MYSVLAMDGGSAHSDSTRARSGTICSSAWPGDELWSPRNGCSTRGRSSPPGERREPPVRSRSCESSPRSSRPAEPGPSRCLGSPSVNSDGSGVLDMMIYLGWRSARVVWELRTQCPATANHVVQSMCDRSTSYTTLNFVLRTTQLLLGWY